MNNLDKKDYYNILFSYYKNLLTLKQQDMFTSYYEEDYSLGEIAESMNVSRNAVYDALKKCENLLDSYEEKLGLYKDALKRKELYQKYYNDNTKDLIEKLEEME